MVAGQQQEPRNMRARGRTERTKVSIQAGMVGMGSVAEEFETQRLPRRTILLDGRLIHISKPTNSVGFMALNRMAAHKTIEVRLRKR